jgi:D-glycero-D-manno-heptose 1,7-bisphosphate phosphatase
VTSDDRSPKGRVLRPALFLDRDGTLMVDSGYVGTADEVVLIDGAATALAELRDLGYALVVATNQSGVARGLFESADVEAVHRRLDQLLSEAEPHARVDAYYWCPHGPGSAGEEVCRCRKPRPGLILQAAADLDLDLRRSGGIGDADRDVEAAIEAGCGHWIRLDNEAGLTLAAVVDDVRAWTRLGAP